MKLATILHEGRDKLGALTPDGTAYVDFAVASAGAAAFDSMLALIEAGDAALDRARELLETCARSGDHLVAADGTRLLAPIPVPPQIRDAMCFPTHIRQGPVGARKLIARLKGLPVPDITPEPEVPKVYRERPIYYIANRFTVAGPDDVIRWPRYSRFMDFELEVAMVVGRTGKDIPVERAGEHIFGYTIFNDFSARDAQMAEMSGMLGPAKGKSFDTGNALGPWLVTRDEVGDIRTLRATARINGEPWVSYTLGEMLHSFEEIIAYISRDETLRAGEIIGSGTVGNGCGLEQDRYLADGDVVELEVEKLGILRNRVVRQEDGGDRHRHA